MEKTIVIPTNGVTGDITSCKIETQHIKTEKKSVFSLTKVDTYASYDVCSKQIIERYEIPSLAFSPIQWGFNIVIVAAIVYILYRIINDKTDDDLCP